MLQVLHPNINNPSNFYEGNLVENVYHFYVNPQLKADMDTDLTSCLNT